MKKYIYIVLSLNVNFMLLLAQSTIGNDVPGFNLAPFNSPQVSSILRFDQSPVDLYTGKIDLTIPLINFEDKDFHMPISIKYNSGGFRPAESDNFVGNSWTMSPNFVIYREVKGVPDDLMQHAISDAIYKDDGKLAEGYTDLVSGFLKVKNNGLKINAELYKKEILDDPYSAAPLWHTGMALMKHGITNPTTNTRIGTEISSDIYHFTCGKYSGHFTIDFDGQVKAESTRGGAVTVDINGYNMVDAYNPPANNTSEIRIRTDDGFYYVFGGDYSAIEYSALSWVSPNNPQQESPSMQIASPIISAFFLTKIIAPNGRVLTISYDNYVSDKYHKNPRLLAGAFNDEALKNTRRRYQLSAISTTDFFHASVFDADRYSKGMSINHPRVKKIFSVRKLAFIKTISVDGKTVFFDYSNKEKNILDIDKDKAPFKWYDFHPSPLKLDSITYSVGGQIIDRVDFKYHDNGRLFLTDVETKCNGKYKFIYNSMASKGVSPITTNIDHWGFVIDGTVDNIIPVHTWEDEVGFTSTVSFTSIGNDRDPRSSGFNKFVLSEVIYPTGGRHKFSYELNDYNHEVQRSLSERFFPTYKNINNAPRIAGGTRIKKIRLYDQNDVKVKETHFVYRESLDDNKSSGILYNKPTYFSPIIYLDGDGTGEIPANPKVQFSMLGNSAGLSKISESGHIAYSSVIEMNHLEQTEKADDYKYSSKEYLEMIKENGYQKRTFTSWDRHADFVGGPLTPTDRVYAYTASGKKMNDEAKRIDDIRFQQFGYWENGVREMLNISQERGLPLKTIIYSGENKPIKEEEYSYQRFPYLGNAPLNDDKYTLYINSPYEYPYTKCVRKYAQVARRPFYQFKQMKKQTRYWGDLDINTVEQYDYTDDGIYLTSTKITDSRGNTNSKKYEYRYKSKSAPYIPSSITKESVINNNKHNYTRYYNYVLKENITDKEKYPFNNQQTLSDIQISYNRDIQSDAEFELECRIYDKYGNPVYVIGRDNNPIIYLWSYYGHYPIAKIEGITYDQIKAYNINADVLAGRSQPDSSEYDNIRKLEEKFPNISITTYKYKEAVGMISMTTPAGKTTYYEYDSTNRLKRTYFKERDPSGKEVAREMETYDYNYKNK